MTPLEIALGEYGNKAIPGKENNADVVKYFHEIGYNYINDDETPWCAAFLNWVFKKANLPHLNKLNARSWLTTGQMTLTPKLGDVVVLWRVAPDSWEGHVGIFIRLYNDNIYILGGNENNMVQIEAFPKSQLLGYRTY